MKKKKMIAAEGNEISPTPAKPLKEKRLTKRELIERALTLPFMLPSFLGVMLFFILPFLVVIYYSVIDSTSTANFVGLDNFIKLFNNSAFKLALKKYRNLLPHRSAACRNTFACPRGSA